MLKLNVAMAAATFGLAMWRIWADDRWSAAIFFISGLSYIASAFAWAWIKDRA